MMPESIDETLDKDEAEEETVELTNQNRCEAVVEEKNKLSTELDEWLAREECIWKQRARIEWLKEGDRNKAFFHARASHRRKINRINGLENEQGQLISEERSMLRIVEEYFRKTFALNICEDMINWTNVLDAIPRRVIEEMNRRLNEPFTMDEVRRSLYQRSPTKAPGVDGSEALGGD
ncbi:hypothetical protein QQ045_015969 [Rhodiola kirilowii]